MQTVSFQSVSTGAVFTTTMHMKTFEVKSDSSQSLTGDIEIDQEKVTIHIHPSEVHADQPEMFVAALDAILGQTRELKMVSVGGASNDLLGLQIDRAEFYQRANFWNNARSPDTNQVMMMTDGRRHPVRAANKAGVYYRRYAADINKTISFRRIDIEKDLNLFHQWHNQPSVYDLWDLNKSHEELRYYLQKALIDAHMIPMIAEVDGNPIGYFEIYWAVEDRLASYYDYELYDRGFHFLIGERKFLGRANTKAVVSSVMHMIFLEDSRTQRIVVEPRADNKKVLLYAQLVPGWTFIKEFDFPHKRAALLMATRSEFFGKGAL